MNIRAHRRAPLLSNLALLGLGGFLSLFALGCELESTQDAGQGATADGIGECPSFLVLTQSDYVSTNVALLRPEGEVASESLISSASELPGLTTPLSGDVVSPSQVAGEGPVVLIDRYPNAVLTWVDPATAEVLGQLPVGTGFGSNPHDYLQVAADKAYVTRFESNPSPGAEPFDAGGDLLLVDPGKGELVGSVALDSKDDGVLLPRPDRMVRVGEEVWVSLGRISADYAETGDARIVGVDVTTDKRTFSLDLKGLAGCSSFAVSPAGDKVALACAGAYGADGSISKTGVVLLDASASPPKELARFDVQAALGSPPSAALAFATEGLLLGTTVGDFGEHNDLAYSLELETGEPTQLFESGGSFVLGDVRCLPGCSERCFVTDADKGVVRVWEVKAGQLVKDGSFEVNAAVGLPPRGLGAL